MAPHVPSVAAQMRPIRRFTSCVVLAALMLGAHQAGNESMPAKKSTGRAQTHEMPPFEGAPSPLLVPQPAMVPAQ